MSDFLDLSGADTSGFEPLPTDEYESTVLELDFTEASTGAPMVKAIFACSEDDNLGRKLYTNFVLRGKTEEGTKRLLGSFCQFVGACVGKTAEEVKAEGVDMSKLKELEGSEVVLRVGPPDEGFDFNKIKGVKPAGTAVKRNAAANAGLI